MSVLYFGHVQFQSSTRVNLYPSQASVFYSEVGTSYNFSQTVSFYLAPPQLLLLSNVELISNLEYLRSLKWINLLFNTPCSLLILLNCSILKFIDLVTLTSRGGLQHVIGHLTNHMKSYMFSSLRGLAVRNELLFLALPPLIDFTLAAPGLQDGERTSTEDDRRLGLDSRESSEMIDMLSSSSSGWKTLARADVPWKQSISTCSCSVDTR